MQVLFDVRSERDAVGRLIQLQPGQGNNARNGKARRANQARTAETTRCHACLESDRAHIIALSLPSFSSEITSSFTMANLMSLPLELLVYISSFVSTSDLAALRLTCKQTEKSLYEWFSEEFFVKKQFMLTQPSLQVLLDISRHVSLSKKLKHLIIATNVYDDIPLRFRDSDACSRSVSK